MSLAASLKVEKSIPNEGKKAFIYLIKENICIIRTIIARNFTELNSSKKLL
jgi:hypothetical protein